MEHYEIVDTYDEMTVEQSMNVDYESVGYVPGKFAEDIDGLYWSELAADGGTTRRPLELDLVAMEEDNPTMLRKPRIASADDGSTRRPL